MSTEAAKRAASTDGYGGRGAQAPSMSVVIPVYRAESLIGDCLRGLMKAGFDRSEIVVVDDCSPDRSAEESRALGVRVLRTESNIGAANARNLGARETSGEILVFVDQDVVAHPDARTVIANFFRDNPGYSALFGAYDDAPSAPGRISRIRNLLHRHVHVRSAGDAVTYWTGLGAIRRSAFEAVGGFDPGQYMMEDIKLGLDLTRAGHKIRLVPELEGTHLKKWTLGGMLRTDLWDRAVPWSRLLLSGAGRDLPRSLNVGLTGQASVLLVAIGIAALGLGAIFQSWTGVWIAALSALGMALVNRAFLADLWRLGRPLDALAAIPVLWLHYLCAGTGYALVRAGYRSPPPKT